MANINQGFVTTNTFLLSSNLGFPNYLEIKHYFETPYVTLVLEKIKIF